MSNERRIRRDFRQFLFVFVVTVFFTGPWVIGLQQLLLWFFEWLIGK